MKLSELHRASPLELLEEITPEQQEKLHFISMMISRQGKDPGPIMQRIYTQIDPEGKGKTESGRAAFQLWLKDAMQNDEKIGRVQGRKVKITVLESSLRDVISEGFFGDLGKIVLKKIRNVFRDEPEEDRQISDILNELPLLRGLRDYAMRAKESVENDPKFWDLVKKAAGQNVDVEDIKAWARMMQKRRMAESIEKPVGFLTECCTIEEMRISQAMQELGLDPDVVKDLLATNQIGDEDYDISRIKAGAAAPFKAAAKRAGQVRGKVKDAATDVRDTNENFADAVILATAAVLKLVQKLGQGGGSPQEKQQAVAQVAADMGATTEVNKSELTDPSIIPGSGTPRSGILPGSAPAPV